MRVRIIQLRILGAALTALWIAAFGLVLLGYRPGGPVDLAVGVAALGPILLALAAVLWPPVARGDRAFAAIAWLGMGAVLLLIPSLRALVDQLEGRGAQTLLPSIEAAYPWLLALLATGLFAGLGIARHRLGETAVRGRRLVTGSVLGVALVLVTGTAFGAAAIVNELALADRPAIASRFGPTDPSLEVPDCNGRMEAGETSKVRLLMDGAIDGQRMGQARLDGIRNGPDFRYSGFAASRMTLGQQGMTRVEGQAWRLRPARWWESVTADVAAGHDMDRSIVLVALTPDDRAVAEDRGIAFLEGARARHCRITLDGDTLRRALPQVNLIVGATDLSRWRGDLDYWVFADGQLGQAEGRLDGPAGSLDPDALNAVVRFRLTATDRGLPISVLPPLS
ncbi:MAG TPA: hypothetical protein VFY23_03235 [Candidatus Limnocylindrales bacterium]|nr:hypothetical protein [Candidatus Limnocylindrales bacterium]